MQLTIPLPFQANNPPHTRRNTVSDAANAELAVTAINRRGIWASTVPPVPILNQDVSDRHGGTRFQDEGGVGADGGTDVEWRPGES